MGGGVVLHRLPCLVPGVWTTLRWMSARYEDVVGPLRTAYDGGAAMRDAMVKEPWKLAERQAFLDRVRSADGRRLLEVGAGAGQDSLFFQDNGLDVVAVDLSPAMVDLCRAKRLDAHVRDLLNLGLDPESFDAVYSFNCLLHVPNRDLSAALKAIRTVLRPAGLFFLGVYGGDESSEGPLENDRHQPPRFFSFRTDEQLQLVAAESFEVVDFHVRATGGDRFQSLTLRRATDAVHPGRRPTQPGR